MNWKAVSSFRTCSDVLSRYLLEFVTDFDEVYLQLYLLNITSEALDGCLDVCVLGKDGNGSCVV